jgi:hypothetical protein
LTWFRKDNKFRFLQVDENDDCSRTLDELKQHWSMPPKEFAEFTNSPLYFVQQNFLKMPLTSDDVKKQRQYQTHLYFRRTPSRFSNESNNGLHMDDLCRKIFRPDMNIDTILHLMAQRVPSDA